MMRAELQRLIAFSVIPLLALSLIVSTVIGHTMVTKYVHDNASHMEYIRSEMDIIIKELDALNLSFSVNNEVTSVFSRFFDMNDMQALNALKNICKNYLIPIVVSRDHIHSIYFYTENQRHIFLTSTVGPANYDEYIDYNWLSTCERMEEEGLKYQSEIRETKDYQFEGEMQNIVSLYQSLYLQNGIIILNLEKEYFDDLLTAQRNSESQMLFTVNDQNQILMQSHDSLTITSAELAMLREEQAERSSFMWTTGRIRYLVTTMASNNRYQWTYFSLTPLSEVFSFLPALLMSIVFTFSLTFIVTGVIAWKHAKKNTGNAIHLLEMLDRAEKHQEILPQEMQQDTGDYYNTVIQKITEAYVEKNHLIYLLEQKQKTLKEIELNALRSQINPHFLFNTLKSIYWMSFSLTGGPNDVSKMLENMTAILEYSIESGDDLATLHDEIDNTRSYIDIQQMRYKDRFEVLWDYDQKIENYYCVKLLLQPLVENSITHGTKWNSDKKIAIKISIVKIGQQLHLSIEDNGCGIPAEQLDTIRSKLDAHSYDGHMGLYNCNKRLCLTFGDESRIQISSGPNGTCVSTDFPCITLDK